MVNKPLEGRVALISGASRGLGRAMAVALAQGGAKLALVARDKAKLEETAAEVRQAGAEAQTFIADVADEIGVDRLKHEVTQAYGHIDILINNAGINHRKNLVDFSYDEWRRVMDTNINSVFLMCRAFVPGMKGHGYGRIINM